LSQSESSAPNSRRKPRVVGGEAADASLAYNHIAHVPAGVDIEAPLRELLAAPEWPRCTSGLCRPSASCMRRGMPQQPDDIRPNK
jgi:hypothetical protein